VGIGPVALALYSQCRKDSIFSNMNSVAELGSQDMGVRGYEALLEHCIAQFSSKPAGPEECATLAIGSGRDFHQRIGASRYLAIDPDSRHGALPLDLNFDKVPAEHFGRYDLVTNHGTTEHVLNQSNAFEVMHDLCKPCGLMIHILPFHGLGYLEHCFFSYHPGLFEDLALANDYSLLGMWCAPNEGAVLIPWFPKLFEFMHLRDGADVLIAAILKKHHEHAFNVPYQGVYAPSRTPDVAKRYSYIVNGEIINGTMFRRSKPHARTARNLLRFFRGALEAPLQ
jgi:hypothetical protein